MIIAFVILEFKFLRNILHMLKKFYPANFKTIEFLFHKRGLSDNNVKTLNFKLCQRTSTFLVVYFYVHNLWQEI